MTVAWTELRSRAINAFNGELPNAPTEQELIDAFQLQPLAVQHALDQVAEDFKAGKARSGWAVWRSRIANVFPGREAVVETGDRTTQIQLVEQWLKQAGGYLDREDELVDAVFGPHGRLYLWDLDEALKGRVLRLWQEQRPRFAAAEQEAEARQLAQAQTLKRLRKASMSSLVEGHAERVAAEIARVRGQELDDLAATVDLEQTAGTLDDQEVA